MPNLEFGPPIDPAYTRFLEGLKKLGQYDWWHIKDEKWYRYESAKWGMEDIGLPDTSPGNALNAQFVRWTEREWTVQELWVPDLFKLLRKVGTKYIQMYPNLNLVWTPRGGGDWRVAFKRKPSDPWKEPERKPPPPPRCLEQIEQINEYQRRGLISVDTARRLKEAILTDCI